MLSYGIHPRVTLTPELGCVCMLRSVVWCVSLMHRGCCTRREWRLSRGGSVVSGVSLAMACPVQQSGDDHPGGSP